MTDESRPAPYVAVAGSAGADAEVCGIAEEVGHRLADAGALLVCGGLGGVMEAACRGAKRAGGTTVGILPSGDRGDANPSVDIALATGLGEARNALIAAAVDVLIAIDGEYGTLSEIALALRAGTPVIGIASWELGKQGRPIDALVVASSAEEAVDRALALARARSPKADGVDSVG